MYCRLHPGSVEAEAGQHVAEAACCMAYLLHVPYHATACNGGKCKGRVETGRGNRCRPYSGDTQHRICPLSKSRTAIMCTSILHQIPGTPVGSLDAMLCRCKSCTVCLAGMPQALFQACKWSFRKSDTSCQAELTPAYGIETTHAWSCHRCPCISGDAATCGCRDLVKHVASTIQLHG